MQGILLLNKPAGRTSFSLIPILRKLLQEKTIGHAGTLDPFATGVMVMLIGKEYTRRSNQFLCQDKEYLAQIALGTATDSYDCTGIPTHTSPNRPTLLEIQEALSHFQGTILQTPPMFSAKKVQGKRLYLLAREGKSIERTPSPVTLKCELLSYNYPLLDLKITCSKGTYIRSLAHDLGLHLCCFGHLKVLTRTRSGPFHLQDCLPFEKITTAKEHITY